MEQIQHPQLGIIHIIRNARARRIIMRVKPTGIYLTAPTAAAASLIQEALNVHQQQLQQAIEQQPSHNILPGMTFHALGLTIQVQTYQGETLRATFQNETFTIHCPHQQTVETPSKQRAIREAIRRNLQYAAKKQIPFMVLTLAKKHNLTIRNITITTACKRWGSCSSSKNISISCYALLLPAHLLEYLILHELAHTIHMNHSPLFYDFLNQLCNHRNQQFKAELAQFRSPLML